MFWSQFLLTIRSDRDMMKIVAPNFFASKNLAAKNALDCSKMSKINIGLKELAPIYFHDFRLFRLCFSYLCIYLRSWMYTTFADISIVFLNAQNDKYSSLIRTNSFIEFSHTPEIFFVFKTGGTVYQLNWCIKIWTLNVSSFELFASDFMIWDQAPVSINEADSSPLPQNFFNPNFFSPTQFWLQFCWLGKA